MLKDASPDAGQHIVLGSGLDDRRFDAVGSEEMGQQHSGRAGSDDRDVGAHPDS